MRETMLEKLSDKNKHRGLKYRKKSGRRQKVFPVFRSLVFNLQLTSLKK